MIAVSIGVTRVAGHGAMCGFGGKVSRADLSATGGCGFERLMTYALAQKRVHKKSLGALLHLLLFSGFVVLTIGTTLLGIAYDGPYNFHHGWYYLIYELTMDVFGVAFCLGCHSGHVSPRLSTAGEPRT